MLAVLLSIILILAAKQIKMNICIVMGEELLALGLVTIGSVKFMLLLHLDQLIINIRL